MKTLLILSLLLIIGCKNQNPVTKQSNYIEFLTTPSQKVIDKALKNNQFWQKKVISDSTQPIYLSKLASSERNLYEITGEIKHLASAKNSLERALQVTDTSDVGLIHQTIQNYIQQHRFKACLPLLDKALEIGYKLNTSYQLAFDIHLELGNDTLSEDYLKKFKDHNDFNYLIRRAKSLDSEGDLDGAISYLELATKITEASKNKERLVWLYSNLGDFYGHRGAIKKSYRSFLKTLALSPSNDYALKGIAWIAFSHEKNINASTQIMDTLIARSKNPNYLLLKYKIERFNKRTDTADQLMNLFMKEISQPEYGNMFNTPLIESYLNSGNIENQQKALLIAEKEIKQVRNTPMSYSWYARVLLAMKNQQKALQLINDKVLGKTEEPVALLNAALVLTSTPEYKDLVKSLKANLLEATHELGPNSLKTIEAL